MHLQKNLLYFQPVKCMLVTGKNKKIVGFSLVEILVSLAIFSFIITGVLTVSFKMLNAQKQIQAELFLAQTAQTTLELMSRQLRYGYNYTGSTQDNYNSSSGGETITLNTSDLTNTSGASASSSQNLVNAQNSPFIMFEGESGNPNDFTDQIIFCSYNGKLYKVSKLQVETTGTTYTARCDSGASMLPDNIVLNKISFDIYAGDSQNPKNPMVRIKMEISHEDTGKMDLQTTVTQRLVSYF